jgi:hypothetical protein
MPSIEYRPDGRLHSRSFARRSPATLQAAESHLRLAHRVDRDQPLALCRLHCGPGGSSSRPLHQSSRAVVWWFVRVRRAELLRICCAGWLERRASTEASCWNDGVR